MDPSAIVGALGAALGLLLLAALLGCVLALVAGVMWVRDRALSPGIAVAAVGLPLLVGFGAAALALGRVGADPSDALAAAVGYRLITVLFALPATAFLALFAAVAGARTTPRRWVGFGLGLGLALATAGITIAGGYAEEDTAFALLRGAVHAALGLLLGLAMLTGDDEEGSGAVAAASVGATFALVVGALEAAAMAMERTFLMTVMMGVEDRGAYLEMSWADVIAPYRPWHLATLAAGCLVGLAALWPGLRSGRRGVLWALPWIALAAALPFVGAVGPAHVALLAEAAPPVAAPAPETAPAAAPEPAAAPAPAAAPEAVPAAEPVPAPVTPPTP